MERQGCDRDQRGSFVNTCLVAGNHTQGGRILKDGYDLCLQRWDGKHKQCVEKVVAR